MQIERDGVTIRELPLDDQAAATERTEDELVDTALERIKIEAEAEIEATTPTPTTAEIPQLSKSLQDRVHPAAAEVPMMPGAELDRLADDIKANGLQLPIVILAKIKDHHRLDTVAIFASARSPDGLASSGSFWAVATGLRRSNVWAS
jgi:hypothetical protein